MRPHDARSARRRAADARRRLRIQTSWLPGFPLDGAWQPFAPEVVLDPKALPIGAEEIRRAERAPVDLPRELADRVVDDGWADTLRWVVLRAKEKKLRGSASERYRPTVRKLFKKIAPELANAISWWRLFAPSEVPEDLEAAAHPVFAEVLARHGLLRAMRLLRIERIVGLGEIKGWLADPRAYVAPAKAVTGADVPARLNSVRNGLTAAAWWLHLLDGATPNQIRMVAAAASGPDVREVWLADRAGYVAQLERLERAQIARSDERLPTSPALPTFTPVDCEDAAAYGRALRAMPDGPTLPRLMLTSMIRSGESMACLIKALGSPFPWVSMVRYLDHWRVSHTLLYEEHPDQIAALVSEPCTPEWLERAADAVRIAGPRAAELLACFPESEHVQAGPHAFALSVAKDPATLRRLVAVVPADFWRAKSDTLALAGAEALIRWFGDHHGHRLEALAGVEALAGRPIGPPPDLVSEAWWSDLPEPFHAAASELAKVDEDAQATVRRILKPVLPDREAIEAEVAWIDTQPTDHPRAESLAKRRAILLRLRESPPSPGPKRIENLVADIDRTRWDKRLERWERHARDVTAPILRDRLGLQGDVGVLFDPRYAKVIAGSDDLDGAFTRLLARVLQARLGPPPWDLRDPANDRIAARFAALGLDVRPWVERDLVHEGAMPEGGTFRIRLEPDPLEVLRMGEHFGTCLTPGNVNWFSAVANAADWHRQVAYARDVDGTVLGRVLICLTEQGGLLSFNLYAHRHEEALEEAMAAFVQALAAKMGTAVVAFGRVPLAVAPRWYDDGPDDRTLAYPALDPDSEFRVGLRTVSPANLRSWIAKAFSPPPPAPLVLGWLAGLSEVYERRDLLLALLPDADVLSDEDPGKIELYRRLYAAGERDRVVAWARSSAPDALRRRWNDPHVDWLFDLALEEFPGRILHWVRELSPCRACGFEHDGFAAFQAARACVALYRPTEVRRYLAAATGKDVHTTLPVRFDEAARQMAV